MMKLFNFGLLLSILAFSAQGTPLVGRYLVAGGGFYPEHSEVVLEKNVELFRETATLFNLLPSNLFTLFASGTDTTINDVSIQNPALADEELLFSVNFIKGGHKNLTLRHNKLPNLLGSTEAKHLSQQLADASKVASSTVPFRFYYTGHGAYERPAPPPQTPNPLNLWRPFFTQSDSALTGSTQRMCDADIQSAWAASQLDIPVASVSAAKMTQYRKNYMALWNSTQMNVEEYTTALDAFPADAPIQTVMVQCFSGGFAQMNFVKGDAGGAVSKANRCGFFATVPSRVAAGCSADINQREEYSPYFLAAIRGKTETGQAVNADFDGDGKVTSDEAHAYVILNERALDVPITTSSALLRELDEGLPEIALKADWAWYEQRFTKIERAVVDGLSKELGFDATKFKSPVTTIRSQIVKLYGALNAASQQAQYASAIFSQGLSQIVAETRKANPILDADYEVITKDPARVADVQKARDAFKAHAHYGDLLKLYTQQKQLQEQADKIQHVIAKVERLGYAFETKALEDLLANAGNAELTDKYRQLKACEHEPFFR